MSHISPVIWQFLVKWMTNFALFPPEASKIAPQMDALYFFMSWFITERGGIIPK